MATTEIRVSKKGSARPVLTLVRGDERTHIVSMIVQRYYGGVDLAPIVWSVIVRNEAGASDTFYVPDAVVDDASITINWVVRGVSTLAVGETEFELEGIAEVGDDAYIWQSGKYIIAVTEDVNHTPGEEEAAQLSAVQELILYVSGELKDVAPTMAAVRTATDAANTAAASANAAAKKASDTESALRKAWENGEFKGDKGDKGDMGELSVTDDGDGNVVVTSILAGGETA